MRLTVRTVVGVMAVSATAAGLIASWAMHDIPVPLPSFELPQLRSFEPQDGAFELQRGIFEPEREAPEPRRDILERSGPGGFEHAPRPYRRVVEVLAAAGLPQGLSQGEPARLSPSERAGTV